MVAKFCIAVALLATVSAAAAVSVSISCSWSVEGIVCTECRAEGGLVTCTTLDPEPYCVGDCNFDRLVSIDELTHAVQIGLGERPPYDCLALACNISGVLDVPTIECVIAAVRAALDGCPSREP